MSNLLQLTLFGSPEIRRHGQPVTGFRSSKAQALLYFLAVTGRPHTRPTLAGLFWGDQPEAAARTSLSKCISNLRDLVGDAVLVDRQTVAFNPDHPYHLDTERFIADIGQPPTVETVPSLQAALTLYRGDFLEGFYVRDAPDFEQWVLVQRAHYREAVVNGLHALANFCDQQGDLPQAIAHTRRLLALEPWREEAHRQLMRRLAASGQRAAALAQFETCRQVLVDELGVEPDPETIAVVEAIRAGKFDKVNTPHSHLVTLSPLHHVLPTLPIPPTPLIGRERELAELGELISDPQCRLITITGPGGMGKTRLALAASADQSGNFQHGAVFVPLAGVSSAQFLPQAMLTALNIPLQGDLSLQQQVRLTLANQECLLVLDNYEHLLPDVELLVDLLHYAPKVTWLVTSRERLALQAEHLLEMVGLAYPPDQTRQGGTKSTLHPTSYAALQLFLQRVRQIQPSFTTSEAEMGAIVRICRISEGMPLALELAAAMVRVQSCVGLAAALEQGQARLASHLRDLPERHRSVHATMDHSWRLLSPIEQKIFRSVSVFRGGFEFNAAQKLTRATRELLLALVDKALLRYEPSERYSLHELIRQYASEKLDEAGEKDAIQHGHCIYYLDLVTSAEPELHRPQSQLWFNRLEHDHDNIRAALSNSLHTDPETALRLAAAVGEFWYLRGHYSEGRSWLEQALAQSAFIVSSMRAKALQGAGRLAYVQGDQPQAIVRLEESQTLFQQLEDWQGVVDSLNFLGMAELLQNNLNRAHTLFEEALSLCREGSNQLAYATTVAHLGMEALYQGHYDQAKRLLTEGLTICYAVQDSNLVENLTSTSRHK